MSVGGLDRVATCKKHLQVRTSIGRLRAAQAGHRRSVVKDSLTTDSGPVRRRAATIEFGLIVVRSLRTTERKINATGPWKLEALDERIEEGKPQ
jgi:hypothetical protein